MLLYLSQLIQLISKILFIVILNFKQQQLRNKNISYFIYLRETYYKYMIAMESRNKKWQIYKRYSEIKLIHSKLIELFNDLPQFPKKQIFHLNRVRSSSKCKNLMII
ncbi:unnamed protein product [Paramecium sonneborni]|uniref:PX domain-containing protein n=1 Tax=Paramecium sonneborni TaxID=65129 RepID=A0A8S1MUT1_9CILI|nr:unnamed protein product [Paramecium sonneborni]